MSQIENSTKQIVTHMTSKLEEFALAQGEKLDALATLQQTSFTRISTAIETLNQRQATKQQGDNNYFDSILQILQSIQSAQQSASKRTRSPTTNIDPLPDHKKPASTRDSSLDLDSMEVSSSCPPSQPPDRPPDQK